MDFIGPEPCLPMELKWYKTNSECWCKVTHSRLWSNIEGCRDSKLYFKEPDRSRAKFLLKLSKAQLSTLIRALTGHCRFNLHMSRLGLSNSLLCPSCGTDYDTPYHLLCLCPSFAGLRHDLFGDFVLSLEEYQGLTLKKILRFLRESNRVL